MQKSPIKQAIEVLEKFSESLEFTKEGKTAVDSSISILQPLIEEERKVYIEMCIDFLQLLVLTIEKREFDKFDEHKIVSFVANYLSDNKLPIGDYLEITNPKVNPNSKPLNLN